MFFIPILILTITTHLGAIPLLKSSPYPEVDNQNMFNLIYSFPEQLEQAVHISKRITLQRGYDQINQIMIIAIGEAMPAGTIITNVTKDNCKKPIILHDSYHLPEWVDEHTLILFLSYAGNTIEMLNCFQEAHDKKIPIFGICSGGALLDQLLTYNYDYALIPSGMNNSTTIGYLIIPTLFFMHKLEYISQKVITELETTAAHLKHYRDSFSTSSQQNPAYLYATNLKQYMPIIFGESETTHCIAQRWKQQFAQISKMLAHTEALPELIYSGINGWQNNPAVLKGTVIIWLLDATMNQYNRMRVDIIKKLIETYPITQLQFEGAGNNWTHRLFYLLYFGDWISYWCAIAHNTNPATSEKTNILQQRVQ